MKTYLQFLKGDSWEFLFCESERDGLILSSTKENALPGRALEYFRSKFPFEAFRVYTGEEQPEKRFPGGVIQPAHTMTEQESLAQEYTGYAPQDL